MSKKGTNELRKAVEDEARSIAASDLHGMEERDMQAWCGVWTPVEEGKIPNVFVAKPSIGNAVAAMKNRHFKIGS